jgi:hypothetical protein
VTAERRVTRAAYDEKRDRLPAARPKPSRWRYAAGHEPERVTNPGLGKPQRAKSPGRRPSHAANATKG